MRTQETKIRPATFGKDAGAVRCIALMLTICFLQACASPPPLPPKELVEIKESDRIDAVTVGPGDVFEVRVFREKDLSGVFRVGADGTIRFPLVGKTTVTNLTAEGISDRIRGKLQERFLKDPHVVVFVREFNSKKVAVLGQVGKPGNFPYAQGMNVVQAIAMAGGIGPLARGDRTVVTRIVKGTETRIIVPIHEISKGRRPNVILKPGDIVYVPESIL
jgi:polysaccharide export outer membrane protein